MPARALVPIIVMAWAILASVILAPVILAGAVFPAWAETTVAEPAGYRLDDYRAPTPATIRGGTALDTAALQRLLGETGVVLIDVLPHPPKPATLPPGTLWIDKPRDNIPGSVWLPEVGRGDLAPEIEAYFRRNLARLTAGDADRPLVFYCLAQCWMSWNAAKRALEWGYHRVYWYRDGTDGWTAAGLATARSTPVPIDAPASP
jgi:PQQ-dependent catabolism-associated CXXCW motif protein